MKHGGNSPVSTQQPLLQGSQVTWNRRTVILLCFLSRVYVDRQAQNGPQPETAVTRPIILQHTKVICRIYSHLERAMVA